MKNHTPASATRALAGGAVKQPLVHGARQRSPTPKMIDVGSGKRVPPAKARKIIALAKKTSRFGTPK